MRKCRYSEYEYMNDVCNYRWVIKPEIATFIKWGVDYEEFESGPGNYTCAIIELDDGEIKMIRADMIKFINDES